jgi:ketosteroid isomerase-like protein
MTVQQKTELALDVFRAYQSADRAAIEALLSEDFTFSSPQDDRIDRATYFERCWPASQAIEHFAFKRVFENDDEVAVNYLGRRADGSTFRNTEIFTFTGNQVRGVEVYFGW